MSEGKEKISGGGVEEEDEECVQFVYSILDKSVAHLSLC